MRLVCELARSATEAHAFFGCGRGGETLYSPSCREGLFSETGLPVMRVLGNSGTKTVLRDITREPAPRGSGALTLKACSVDVKQVVFSSVISVDSARSG